MGITPTTATPKMLTMGTKFSNRLSIRHKKTLWHPFRSEIGVAGIKKDM
jgi:hypothetical protein